MTENTIFHPADNRSLRVARARVTNAAGIRLYVTSARKAKQMGWYAGVVVKLLAEQVPVGNCVVTDRNERRVTNMISSCQ